MGYTQSVEERPDLMGLLKDYVDQYAYLVSVGARKPEKH